MVNSLATSQEDITDDQWSDLTLQMKMAQTQYNGIYNNQTNVTILQSAAEYHSTMQNAKDAWDMITLVMGHQNKTAAQRRATVQQVYNAKATSAITSSALLPEWWAIAEARNLATQYESLANQAKSVAGGKPGAPTTGNAQPGSSSIVFSARRSDRRPRLLPASASKFEPPPHLALAAEGTEDRGSDLTGLAHQYNSVPLWMTNSLNRTRQQYRANWYQTLGSGLGGAVVGFVCMLFLPAFVRPRVKPRTAPEIDLLRRNLSFRTDERMDLEQQLGALHLDMLSYVWNGRSPEERSPSASPRAFQSNQVLEENRGQRLARIEELRRFLNRNT